MFDRVRLVAILVAAGFLDIEIATKAGISPSLVHYLRNFPNRKFRFDDDRLWKVTCATCRFPWRPSASPQIHSMGAAARGDTPDMAAALLSESGPGWIRAVEDAASKDTLDQADWTDLAYAVAYANIEVQASRLQKKARDLSDGEQIQWGKVQARYEFLSSQMLNRLDQIDVTHGADEAWVSLLTYDISVNRIVVPWELSSQNEQALEQLGNGVEELGFFDQFVEFNALIPKCARAPFNALGMASALGRTELFPGIRRRLIEAEEAYEDHQAVLNDPDAGPEFSNFGFWASGSKMGEAA